MSDSGRKPAPERQPSRVFQDPSQRRAPFVAAIVYGVLTLSAAAAASIVIGLVVSPRLPELLLDGHKPAGLDAVTPGQPAGHQRGQAVAPWGGTAQSYAVHAFVPAWSGPARDSAKANLAAIDVLLPEWFEITAAGDVVAIPARERAWLTGLVTRSDPQPVVMPVVGGASFAAALSSPEKRRLAAGVLARSASEGEYGGFCLDPWSVPVELRGEVVRFVSDLRQAFGDSGREACIVVALGEAAWPLETLARVADRVILLGFEEPGTGSPAAPAAPQAWFADRLSAALEQLDPAKTVVALGTAGFEWMNRASRPGRLTYASAMRLAAEHASDVRLDAASLNSTFTFAGAGGARHELWLLDAVSAHNQVAALAGRGIGGVAVWPAGGEDPGVWELLREGPSADALTRVSIEAFVGYEGEGEFLRVVGTPRIGVRRIVKDPATGLITEASYEVPPEGYTIRRSGRAASNMLALTFDDGPDPDFTPRVLDVLKAHNAPAAFFVTGQRALRHSGIVRRIVAEGHEIGSHTFRHTRISRIPAWMIRLGLNATQRVVTAISRRETLLFRAPYGEDLVPLTVDEIRPLTVLTKAGYVAVSADIDPRDWETPGVGTIVSAVRAAALRGDGNIIDLHDAGGDRSQTIDALPAIIETLRAEGFEFVSLATLLGTTRETLMPPAAGIQVVLDSWTVGAFSFIRAAAVMLFLAALALTLARTGTIMVLAVARRRHQAAPDFAPPVTVVVPAYCEEGIIVESVASLLASDYPDINVVVVDDGSTDRTFAVLKAAYASDRRVTVVTQPNRGKAAALNAGYCLAHDAIVVAVDADTRLSASAIRLLVRHFSDPQVGAVAGNVKVINRGSLLTKMQAVEYITSQNLDRRAFETVNSIAVVPGAIGAWRVEAVKAAGGLSSDTLAEDADLTFGIIRAGYRVVYEEEALAMTQAPQGIHQFFRQRLRWSLGMLQTAWKHRAAVREARPLGFVAIPNIVLFGMLLSLVAPLADIVFVASVLGFVLGAMLDPTGIFDPAGLLPFLLYGLFLSSDVLLAAVAFGFEPREPKRLLWWTLLQRFFYRQVLYVVVFRAVYYAFSGRLVGWRKVLRTTDGPPVSAVDRADRRVIDLKWESDDRRRWNRRAMDLNPVGPERRGQRSGIKPRALGKG